MCVFVKILITEKQNSTEQARKRGNCKALQLEASRSAARPPHALSQKKMSYPKTILGPI